VVSEDSGASGASEIDKLKADLARLKETLAAARNESAQRKDSEQHHSSAHAELAEVQTEAAREKASLTEARHIVNTESQQHPTSSRV
jgi:hypothetical protein